MPRADADEANIDIIIRSTNDARRRESMRRTRGTTTDSVKAVAGVLTDRLNATRAVLACTPRAEPPSCAVVELGNE